MIPMPEDKERRSQRDRGPVKVLDRHYIYPSPSAADKAIASFARGTFLSGESGLVGARVGSWSVTRVPNSIKARIAVRFHKVKGSQF